MPDPKDYMDNDHVFVKGHVRRKQAHTPSGSIRGCWFWYLAWYWRLLILFGIIVLLIVVLANKPIILPAVIVAIVFIFLFLRLVIKS